MTTSAPRLVPGDRAVRARRAIGMALMIAGIAAIVVITLTPTAGSERLPLWCVACGARPAVDVLLNVLLFVPVSVGMALSGVGFRRALLYGVAGSVLIESLQFLVVAGRYPSARDVVSNSLGVALGYVAGRRWATLVLPDVRAARALALGGVVLWVATQAFSAWAMGAAAPATPWWAQLRPEYEAYPAVFEGRIAALSIGSVRVVDSDVIPAGDEARRQLLAGAPFRVVLTRVAPTRALALILVISAGPSRDVAYWEQDRRAALLTVPVRGTLVGFRTPSVRIADVVPNNLSDTLVLTGSYAHGRYHLTALRDGVALEREIVASPSMTWSFLLPIPGYAFGAEVRIWTALWLAASWLVLGYWTSRASRASAPGMVMLSVAAALIVGLALVPLMLDLPVAHWSEWIAAVVGCAGGWCAVRPRRRRDVVAAP